MRFSHWAVIAGATTALLVFSSCQRSQSYKRDQDYYQEEGDSYYNRAGGGKNVSQRVEGLGQPKKRVVVFDFVNSSLAKDERVGPFAADELRRGLYATQRVILPVDLKTEFATKDFVQGDQVKVAQLIREGRRLGVSVVVIGRVTKVVFRTKGDEVGVLRQRQTIAAADVEIKAFDVTGGREIMATGRSGEASSNSLVMFEDQNLNSQDFRSEMTRLAVRNTMEAIVPEVIRSVDKLTWQGHIAKIIGGKIYVNAGKQSGLVAGDILRVLTGGDDIYDPATGAYLGRTQGQLKGTMEVVDFLGTDGAVAELHTGGNFAEGDLVRLY